MVREDPGKPHGQVYITAGTDAERRATDLWVHRWGGGSCRALNSLWEGSQGEGERVVDANQDQVQVRSRAGSRQDGMVRRSEQAIPGAVRRVLAELGSGTVR